MKHFSVYLPQNNNLERSVFIGAGFSLKAFIFTIFWALYNRLYFVSLSIFLLILVTETISYGGYLSGFGVMVINMLGLPLFCGFSGNTWLENSLIAKKFQFAGVVIAKNLLEAQMKFFSEHNCVDQDYKINSAW